jgi:hypothetical protein
MQSLKAAAASSDGQKLRDTWRSLQNNLALRSTHRAGMECLVVCAETAIKVRRGAHRLDMLSGMAHAAPLAQNDQARNTPSLCMRAAGKPGHRPAVPGHVFLGEPEVGL